MTIYYMDATKGDDGKDGLSPDTAWKSLWRANSPWDPGTAILFKCGETWIGPGTEWSGAIQVDAPGVEGNPIVFGAYGVGPRPILRNPGINTFGIYTPHDWITVQDLYLQDAHQAAVFVEDGAKHNVIKRTEMSNVGIGAMLHGPHNLVTRNYIHDLVMVQNTPGTDPGDYGAVGVFITASNNEVCYNKMFNCMADSYTFGIDGGATELFGEADENHIHHNLAKNCQGFIEVGGGSARNNVVANNGSINNGGFAMFHLEGNHASVIENFILRKNVVVEDGTDNQMIHEIAFGGDPDKNTVLMYDSSFWLKKGTGPYGGMEGVSNKAGFTHENNLYCLFDGISLGFDLGRGEEAHMFSVDWRAMLFEDLLRPYKDIMEIWR